MKKISFIISLVFTSMTGILTSCSEDYPGPDPVDVTANYSNKFSNPNPNLVLTYSGEEMIGKSVDFSTVKGENAILTLYDIIPGEDALSIYSIPLTGDAEGYSFSGKGVGTATGCTFTYEGRATKGLLTIRLTDIKLENSDLWANNYLFALPVNENEALTVGAAYVDTEMIPGTDNGYNPLLRGILSYLLPQLLQSVTIQEDGNILAEYSPDGILLMGKKPAVFMTEISEMDIMTLFMSQHLEFLFNLIAGNINQSDIDLNLTGRTYQPSPANLAYWYKKDNRMMVKLNLPAVIAQAMKSSGKTVDEQLLAMLSEAIFKIDAVQLKSILISINNSLDNDMLNFIAQLDDNTFRTVMSWLTVGIPMNIQTAENGHTYLYLDKETLQPLLDLLPQLMPMISQLLSGIMSETIAALLQDTIDTLLNDIATDWPQAIRFNIGLDLTTAGTSTGNQR